MAGCAPYSGFWIGFQTRPVETETSPAEIETSPSEIETSPVETDTFLIWTLYYSDRGCSNMDTVLDRQTLS